MKKILSLFLVLTLMFSVLTIAPLSVNAVEKEVSKTSYYECGDYVYVILDDGTAEITAYYNEEFASVDLEIPSTLDGYIVTRIGGFCQWEDDPGIKSVTIPDTVKSIAANAFQRCTSLKSVSIPDSVITIEDYAFDMCWSLESITIPASIKSIGYGVFLDCYNLKSIKVDENNSVYDSRNDCNAIIETATNTLLVGTSNTVIPDTVTSVDNCAFIGPGATLTFIDIPDSVNTIGIAVFSGCRKLEKVTISDSVISIGERAFCDCESLKEVTIPASVTNIGKRAFGYDNPWSEDVVDGFTIYGYDNSEAQRYANENGITFVALEVKPAYALGDVDLDGEVTIIDATNIQRHVAEIITLSDVSLIAADADKDGDVSILDATTIQLFLAEIIPVL